MAELTLLVNSTDTALLGGGAVSPVASNGAAPDAASAGGFSSVLGKQLMPGEGAVATESPPQNIEAPNPQVPLNGEPRPLNGRALPPAAAAVNVEPDLSSVNVSLLSAISQAAPTAVGQFGKASVSNASSLPTDPTLARTGVALQSLLPQQAMGQAGNKRGTPTPLTNPDSPQALALKQAVNLQAVRLAEPSTTSALPNAAQDAQRSVVAPVVSALLGKPISATAEQALTRIRSAAGAINFARPEMLPANNPAMLNVQNNNGSSNVLANMNNLMGNTQRIDIFNAAMDTTTQGSAELRLPTNTATLTPVSLTTSAALPDNAIALSADAPRLPGVVGAGLSPALTVATPVGQSAWANEVGQRVTWLANNELREAQLQLHPRSLGAVEVRIAYGPEQQLNVSFNVTNPIARDALEASLPRLREMFEQQGLNLADANISQESPEEREHRNNMGDELSTQTAMQANNEESTDDVEMYHSPSRWLSEGMLDAYA